MTSLIARPKLSAVMMGSAKAVTRMKGIDETTGSLSAHPSMGSGLGLSTAMSAPLYGKVFAQRRVLRELRVWPVAVRRPRQWGRGSKSHDAKRSSPRRVCVVSIS